MMTQHAPDVSRIHGDSALAKTWPKLLRRSGYVVVMLVCLSLLAHVLSVNQDVLAEMGSRPLRWDFWVAAVGCVVVNQWLTITRWFLLIRALRIPLRFGEVFGAGVAGELSHFVMPSSNGGDLVKAGIILRGGRPKTQLLLSMVVDRATGLYGLLLGGGLAGVVYWPRAEPALARLIVCLWVLLSAASLVGLGLFHPAVVRGLRGLRNHFSRVSRVVEQMEIAAQAFHQRKTWVVLALAISVVSQTLTLTAIYLISCGLTSNRLEWGLTLIAAPLAMISTALPIPFGAIGVSEEICEKLFESLGGSGGGLTLLIMRFVLFIGSLILGLIWGCARRAWPEFAQSALDESREEDSSDS
jgi:uncharacterized protein (TIRG00374 family)